MIRWTPLEVKWHNYDGFTSMRILHGLPRQCGSTCAPLYIVDWSMAALSLTFDRYQV